MRTAGHPFPPCAYPTPKAARACLQRLTGAVRAREPGFRPAFQNTNSANAREVLAASSRRLYRPGQVELQSNRPPRGPRAVGEYFGKLRPRFTCVMAGSPPGPRVRPATASRCGSGCASSAPFPKHPNPLQRGPFRVRARPCSASGVKQSRRKRGATGPVRAIHMR
jgi:hypothetical protein